MLGRHPFPSVPGERHAPKSNLNSIESPDLSDRVGNQFVRRTRARRSQSSMRLAGRAVKDRCYTPVWAPCSLFCTYLTIASTVNISGIFDTFGLLSKREKSTCGMASLIFISPAEVNRSPST